MTRSFILGGKKKSGKYMYSQFGFPSITTPMKAVTNINIKITIIIKMKKKIINFKKLNMKVYQKLTKKKKKRMVKKLFI